MDELIIGLLDRYGVTIKGKHLPGARGMVIKTKGGYCILVRDTLSEQARNQTVAHELLHIMMGHLDDRNYLSTEEKEEEIKLMIKAFKGG